VGIVRVDSNGSLITLNGSLSIMGNACIIMAEIFERISIIRVQFGGLNKMLSGFFLGIFIP